MAIRRDRELRLTLQSEGGMCSSSLSLVEYFFCLFYIQGMRRDT